MAFSMKNLTECLWECPMGGRGRSRFGQRKRSQCNAVPATASADPVGIPEAKWPLRVVLSWAKMGGQDSVLLFTSHCMWALPGRGAIFGEVTLCH